MRSEILHGATKRGRRPWNVLAKPKSGSQRDMCRNIRPLFNFEPPASEEEVRAASLQFVRKISGFTTPSQGNAAAFAAAVDDIAGIASRLLASLETTAAPKNRQDEAAKAKARAARRFGA